MKNLGLKKILTIGVLASAFSLNATAGFLTATADGGFYNKTTNGGGDVGQYVGVDGVTVDANQTSGVLGALLAEAAAGDPLTNLHAGVRWGGNGAYSSLILEDFAPSIDALDTNYMLSALTHNNFKISADFDWLEEANIFGHISFSSDNTGGIAAGFGSGTVVDDFDAQAATIFNIDFKETFNRTDEDDCSAVDEDGIAGGDNHDFITGCDDYFDYTATDVQGNPLGLPFSIPFFIDGKHYALEIFASADEDGSTYLPSTRFWTQEQQSTTIYTFAKLTEVPEPSIIALFGLATIGLGLSRKRKNKLVTA